MTDFQTKAALAVFEFENRIQAGEFDGTPEGNNASNALRGIIATALAAAYEQGKRDGAEQERASRAQTYRDHIAASFRKRGEA